VLGIAQCDGHLIGAAATGRGDIPTRWLIVLAGRLLAHFVLGLLAARDFKPCMSCAAGIAT
jgi:hypothetical protein